MNLIVQKFGGSSVANVERVRHVAQIITDTYAKGNSVIALILQIKRRMKHATEYDHNQKSVKRI